MWYHNLWLPTLITGLAFAPGITSPIIKYLFTGTPHCRRCNSERDIELFGRDLRLSPNGDNGHHRIGLESIPI